MFCIKTTSIHKEDKRALRLREVILRFPHSLLIYSSLCKDILNHREHRGAARYTEKPNYHNEGKRALRLEENKKALLLLPHFLLIHFSL
jgi:hypothetical protein